MLILCNYKELSSKKQKCSIYVILNIKKAKKNPMQDRDRSHIRCKDNSTFN